MRVDARTGGLLLLAIGLGLGLHKLSAALDPPAPGGMGVDLVAAQEDLSAAPDAEAHALALGQQDPTLAFILSLDPAGLPAGAQGPLALYGLHGELRRALLEGSGGSAEALSRALGSQGADSPEGAALATALCPLLDGDDEVLARRATELACALPSLAQQSHARCAPAGLQGQALRLVLLSCGDPGPSAQAALLGHLDPGDPLAPVAALELARRGDPNAIPALTAAATASPDGLLGLAARYGLAVLSEISAKATQPSGPR